MNDIQTSGLAYLSSALFFLTDHAEELAKELIAGTGDKMSVVYLTGSGSEGVEAMVKTALQYFYCLYPNTKRTIIIARENSYHGASAGALTLTQMGPRRLPFNC
jgi:adenosylmethionine-8-amino-7-oxononanoate aminotransferase